MNDDYSKSDTQIWVTDWVFYNIQTANDVRKNIPEKEFIVHDVVCKRIPLRFIMNERLCYDRAIKGLSITTMNTLMNDKQTGLKKFKIIYKKFISKVN